MLSAAIVREVSRTGVPAFIGGWVLTVEELIRRTTGADWRHDYLVIRARSAKRIAGEINRMRPWACSDAPLVVSATVTRPALPGIEGDLPLVVAYQEGPVSAEVVVGELVG